MEDEGHVGWRMDSPPWKGLEGPGPLSGCSFLLQGELTACSSPLHCPTSTRCTGWVYTLGRGFVLSHTETQECEQMHRVTLRCKHREARRIQICRQKHTLQLTSHRLVCANTSGHPETSPQTVLYMPHGPGTVTYVSRPWHLKRPVTSLWNPDPCVSSHLYFPHGCR